MVQTNFMKMQHLREWLTVPILPWTDIEEMLTFWQMLGFEITCKYIDRISTELLSETPIHCPLDE